ncbi:MAG TPA: hypothetical protein VHE55_18165 [Fimbriimonadaceae bacterium]|nr:hypothetical protein [Fimbriimonadaceae bacterium]
MNGIVLLGVLASLAGAPRPQDAANFTRTYTVGAKSSYVTTFSTKLLGGHSISVDIDVSVKKLSDKGAATVLLHMSNKQTTGEGNDTTVLPDDLTYTLAANNMPEHFAATQHDASIFEMFLFLAGSTTDKTAKVGEEVPWSWSDGPIAFKGSTKVLEISPDKKKLKALIVQKMTFSGQEAGTFTLTSTYDLPSGSLISSDGGVEMAGIKQDLKFVRK